MTDAFLNIFYLYANPPSIMIAYPTVLVVPLSIHIGDECQFDSCS